MKPLFALPLRSDLQALVLLLGWAAAASAGETMTAIVVGGGPEASSNAAQIEGHTKFVADLLPTGARHVLLFADGNAKSANVAMDDPSTVGEARRALGLLLPDARLGTRPTLRTPLLGRPIDDRAGRGPLRRAVTTLLPHLGKNPATPLLLYFAGHGSSTGEGESAESNYALWKSESLTVSDLATQIARLSPKTPVVLVMAQCYSGGFAEVLFREGKRKGEPIPQNVVGFFSARRDRTASGCGTETSEADYQDFSSYFFAALAGHNQFARPTPGGDYDQDGQVTLHEAFCFALLHDASFDTPNCTSDLFLRRFTKLPERQVLETPYSEALAAASPAQRAVLEGLSAQLELQGEARALAAYDRLTYRDPAGRAAQLAASRAADDHLSQVRDSLLTDYFSRWPGLRWEGDKDFTQAVTDASWDLATHEETRRELLAAQRSVNQASATLDNEEAFLMRFQDVFTSVLLAREVREHGSETVKSQFARLWAAEQQTLPLQTVPKP